MTKEEAIALFERIHDTLSPLMRYFAISLLYVQGAGLLGIRTWEISIITWIDISTVGGHRGTKITSEQDWRQWKQKHNVTETAEDTDAVVDARRADAAQEDPYALDRGLLGEDK